MTRSIVPIGCPLGQWAYFVYMYRETNAIAIIHLEMNTIVATDKFLLYEQLVGLYSLLNEKHSYSFKNNRDQTLSTEYSYM